MAFRGSTATKQSKASGGKASGARRSAPQRAAGHEEARRELAEQLISQGVEEKRAERVAEAMIRRAQAKQGHTVFHYADVEEEFEQRCRRLTNDPHKIEASKRRVYAAAKATANSTGLPVEEALFFCYQDAIEYYREFLVAVAREERAGGK